MLDCAGSLFHAHFKSRPLPTIRLLRSSTEIDGADVRQTQATGDWAEIDWLQAITEAPWRITAIFYLHGVGLLLCRDAGRLSVDALSAALSQLMNGLRHFACFDPASPPIPSQFRRISSQLSFSPRRNDLELSSFSFHKEYQPCEGELSGSARRPASPWLGPNRRHRGDTDASILSPSNEPNLPQTISRGT